MENENQTPMESAEEIAAEKEDLSEVKEETIRDNIIEEYGFDPDDEKDVGRIDKMVKSEVSSRAKLSKTIGQKVKYRNAHIKDTSDTLQKADPSKKTDDDDLDEDAKFNKRMDKRDLERMEYPDEIKKIIANTAKVNEISVEKAVSDPYVKSKIEEWQKETGSDEAALSNKDNMSGSTQTKANDSDMIPPKVDYNTEEGRKEYDDWLESKIKKEKGV